MKKLMLLCAAFSFMAATSTFAQSNATSADQDKAAQSISASSDAKAEVTTEPTSTPKSCCKAGSSKSCCKDKSKASKKSCSHDHANTEKNDENKAAADAPSQPAAVAPADKAAPKK